ncbi:proline iminopeptidase [Corynebacterium ulcerans]|uniref:Proline iminopeptidase n=2 Tax=Corynebacterium ulcerans TaxID=65058 RepID=A0ABD7MT38_CORUL|nr:prolyl aminopeptidase [Corynebacterium ulcerans]AIU30096.1 Proline iminopeptidase [Corynebacterium ulcerans]AKN76670.1 Proline iminopeptidase [Corynebacterium ulcerans FRC58]NON16885.1 prolyl aminopeptidase [Corynebacterium ulcerans]PME07500.1 proline iminopeptidase [Corynebacterium ulcerans]QQU25863.1 prolyl aminopeptidase [Corynebacterium ulcerans]
MTTLYPVADPIGESHIERDGQRIAYTEYGNPQGIPAVFIHGGPGGGTTKENAGFFDQDKYRVILIDQRGCGKSTPHIADPDIDLEAALAVNTTHKLVEDIEAIRQQLGIDKWLVFGGSWGSTLSLKYIQTHPDRVLAVVLRGIFMLRKTELDWFYNGGAAHLFPDKWERYLSVIPEDKKPAADDLSGATHLAGVDLIAEYHKLLHSSDRAVALEAARAWSVWEGSTSFLEIRDTQDHEDERFALAFARIENHYFVHQGFMRDGELLEPANIERIRDIPAVIVQGRYDVVCPPVTAWNLHRAWPEAEFHFSPTSGHAASEKENVAALVAATDRFAEELSR